MLLEFFFFVYPVGLGYNYKKMLVVILFLTWTSACIKVPVKVRLPLGIGVLILMPVILINSLEQMTVSVTAVTMRQIAYNIMLAFLIELIVLLCTMSIRISVCVTGIGLTLLYSINYFVYIYRGKALSLRDVLVANTALKVMGNYEFVPSNLMVMAWSWLILFVVLALKVKADFWSGIRADKRKYIRFGGAVSGLVVLILCIRIFVNVKFWEDRDFVVNDGFVGLFYYDGYLVSTCLELAYGTVQEPENYSADMAETILKGYELNEQGADKPHIIVVMNESMADLTVWGNLELNEECMPFFESLTDNAVRGYVNASVLGGGTANTEFEVLLGASMGLLPMAYYPYQQCIEPNMESLVSVLEAQGYATYSMHPESRSNWNRDNVYEDLGFDISLWREDFADAEVLNAGVTDYETYKKIIQLYEENKEKGPLFFFDVTMQNHGGYTYTDIENTVYATNLDYKDINTYLSLLRKSDEDFEKLVNYFSETDEKVIICMFGDHQPKFVNSLTYDIIYNETPKLTPAEYTMNLYKTPFVIWANYDIGEESGLDISMNYLGALLLETAGVNQSKYFAYLNEISNEWPIVTVNGFVDRERRIYSWDNQDECFDELRILQYYQLFDEGSRIK